MGNNWAVIWSFVLSLGFSRPALYIGGSSLLHFAIYWSYSALLTYFDLQSQPHLFSRYKIQPAKNAPVERAAVLRCVQQVLVNQFLVAIPTVALTYPLAVWRGVGFDLPLPSFERFCLDMAVLLLVEEALFYYMHRALHSPRLYGRVHKQHHEWTAPIAVATNYCSPLEHLLSNLIPALAGPLLCGSHLSVIWVWQAIATLTSVNTHSGYHLPFMPSPEAHDFHHLRFNVNFGVLGLLDWLHGTDGPFRASQQYRYHKTFFSAGAYEPGLAWLRRREAQRCAADGGRADAVNKAEQWGAEKKEAASDEIKEGEVTGVQRGDSEL